MKWVYFGLIVIVLGGATLYFANSLVEEDTPLDMMIKTAREGLVSFNEGDQLVQSQSSSLSRRGLVYDGSKEWDYDVIFLDELGVNLTFFVQSDNTTIVQAYPYSVDDSRTNKGAYRWKIRVNISGEVTQLAGNLNKNQLNNYYNFTIDADVNEFRLLIGETSTIIDASASLDATRYSGNTNICKTSDGMLHIAYEGGNDDLWYGNGTDLNDDVDIKELDSLTFANVGIICDVNDNLFLYYVSGNDIEARNSTDGGKTWNGNFVIADRSGPSYRLPSCKSNSIGEIGCAYTEASTGLFYDTSHTWANETLIDTSGDGDSQVDLEFNSSDSPFIVYYYSTGDVKLRDVDAKVTYDIASGGSTIHGRGPTMDIKNIDGTDQVWVAYTDTAEDPQVCNSTMNDLSDWDCQEISTSDTDNMDIAITPSGRIEIVHSQHETSNSQIYRTNSSNGINWTYGTRIDTVGSMNYPSIQNSHFPSWNRINETGGRVNILTTRIGSSDVYYENYTIKSLAVVPDTESPSFSSLLVNPSNNSVYVYGQSYQFNSTWTDDTTVDTVLFEFDNINYSPSNNGDEYYYNFSDLSAGTYIYQWYGNDTSNNRNQTIEFNYIIQKANPGASITSTAGFTLTYPTETTIGISESNQGDKDVTYTLFRDGNNITTGETVTLGVGSYEYVLNNSEGQNYSETTVLNIQTLNISKGQGATSLTFNLSSPQTYPQPIVPYCNLVNGVGSPVLTVDGQVITNGSSIVLSGGSHEFNCSIISSDNYTFAQNISEFVINKASTDVDTYINGSRADAQVEVENGLWLNGTLVIGQGDIGLWVDDIQVDFGASPVSNFYNFTSVGSFLVKTNLSQNQNYSGHNETWTVTVVNSTVPGDLIYPGYSSLLVNPSNNSVYVKNQAYQFNSTWTDNEAVDTVIFEFDGVNYSTSVNSNEYYTTLNDLAAGTYSYKWYGNDTSNNKNETPYYTYTIQKVTSTCTVTSNTPVTYPATVTVSYSCTNPEDSGNLYRDSVQVTGENGTSISLAAGSYTYIGNVTATQNYTSATDSESVTVNQGDPGLGISISPSDSVENGTETTVTGTGCPSEISCNLYRDGVLVSNPDVDTLTIGSYNYIYNTTGNINYTVDSVSDTLTVTAPVAPFNGTGLWVIENANWAWVVTIDQDGNITSAGDVDGQRLCIAGDCRTSWPAGGGSDNSGWVNQTTNTFTPLIVNITADTMYLNELKTIVHNNGSVDVWIS